MKWNEAGRLEKIIRVVFWVILVTAISETGSAMRTIFASGILPWHESAGLVIALVIFMGYSIIMYHNETR